METADLSCPNNNDKLKGKGKGGNVNIGRHVITIVFIQQYKRKFRQMIRLIEINERKVNLNPHFEGPCPFLTPGQVLRQKGCVCLEGGFRKPIREHTGG